MKQWRSTWNQLSIRLKTSKWRDQPQCRILRGILGLQASTCTLPSATAWSRWINATWHKWNSTFILKPNKYKHYSLRIYMKKLCIHFTSKCKSKMKKSKVLWWEKIKFSVQKGRCYGTCRAWKRHTATKVESRGWPKTLKKKKAYNGAPFQFSNLKPSFLIKLGIIINANQN